VRAEPAGEDAGQREQVDRLDGDCPLLGRDGGGGEADEDARRRLGGESADEGQPASVLQLDGEREEGGEGRESGVDREGEPLEPEGRAGAAEREAGEERDEGQGEGRREGQRARRCV